MMHVFIRTASYINNAADLCRVQGITQTARKVRTVSGRMIRAFICTASYINNATDLCRVQWNTETARKLKRLSKRMIRVFICTARYIYNAADLYRVQWNTETARKLKALSGRMIHVYIYAPEAISTTQQISMEYKELHRRQENKNKMVSGLLIRVCICTGSYINNAGNLCRVQWNTDGKKIIKKKKCLGVWYLYLYAPHAISTTLQIYVEYNQVYRRQEN